MLIWCLSYIYKRLDDYKLECYKDGILVSFDKFTKYEIDDMC